MNIKRTIRRYKYFTDKYDKRKRKPLLQTKKADETRNYLLEEIEHNNLMSKKHKKVNRVLNYFEYSLVFISGVTSCVSISILASLVGVSVGIASSEVELKMCALTIGIKECKLFTKKKRKKHDN